MRRTRAAQSALHTTSGGPPGRVPGTAPTLGAGDLVQRSGWAGAGAAAPSNGAIVGSTRRTGGHPIRRSGDHEPDDDDDQRDRHAEDERGRQERDRAEHERGDDEYGHAAAVGRQWSDIRSNTRTA